MVEIRSDVQKYSIILWVQCTNICALLIAIPFSATHIELYTNAEMLMHSTRYDIWEMNRILATEFDSISKMNF